MPTVDRSRSFLAAGANYNAGDWATVGAETSLDLLATANLNRGVDLGLGVEALARLDGSIRQYIAADVNGEAHAAARVRAQVQIPLDLFDEAGIAVRLQAVAEAAAGVQLAIGLSVGDFLSLAENDPRLRGAPFELLKIFLDELTIQGGVMAKAAAAAMAYANLVATGTLVKRGSRQPGFTIAAEAGVGLKAGAGFRVFARFGVDDPRRLVRRTIDVAVDETLSAVTAALPSGSRQLIAEAAVPIKIGLRSAFELGVALAENGGAFDASDSSKLALRLTQVGLEEMQRFVLERIVEFATRRLRDAISDLGVKDSTWTAAASQRQALANRLNAVPDEPFEATAANASYWLGVVSDASTLVGALTGNAPIPRFVAEPLAMIWCGAQLLMKSVERISTSQARASVIGVSPVSATAAFNGSLPVAPAAVRGHINSTLGRAASAEITQTNAINYLLNTVSYRIDEISPAAATVLTLLTGKGGAPASEVLSIVFSNLGSFVPGPDGRVNAEASISAMREGLRTYINSRLDAELLPLVISATADAPDVHIYLEEVLLSTLRTVVDTVFDTVLAWQSGNGDTQRALRELCSSLLMRLFGRSLVVTGDVLLAHALELIHSELLQLAANADNSGGIVPTLAGITGLDRELVADLVTETLEVCAETFGPMPDDRRARMRDLMYQMIDTMPPDAGASALESLKSAGMVGNAEAAFELAQLLGEEIAGNLVRFIEALLTRVAAALLALLTDTIADIQRAVEAWVQQIEGIARELMGRLADLVHEIDALQRRLDDVVDDLFAQASALLGGFAEHAGSRSSLRGKIKDAVRDRSYDALADFPGYGALPSYVRREIRRTVRNVIENALDDDIFDPLVDVLISLSAETADLLDDLREIEPGDDLAVAIADIALDRIEDAIRDAFTGDPSIRIKVNAPILGEIDLGKIRVPIDTFVSVARSAIRALGRFDSAVNGAASALASMLDAESDLQAAESEQRAATATKDEADQRIAETRDGRLDLSIVSPQPGSAITGPVKLKLSIPGGSVALLASDGLSHRRLFGWVNDHELSLAGARVSVELPLIAPAPFVPQVSNGNPQTPAIIAPGHPLTRARAARHDAQRKDQLGLRATKKANGRAIGSGTTLRGISAGVINRFGGVSLPTSKQTGGFPPRVAGPGLTPVRTNDLPVLVVEVDVPESMLHEGINSIACTLVPGAAQRRVERAVSFLRVAAAEVVHGRPTRPALPVPPSIPHALATVLTARGVEQPQATRVPELLRQVRGNTWVVPLSTQRKSVAVAHERLKKELATVASQHKEVRAAIAGGALRAKKAEQTSLLQRKGQPQ